MAFHFKRKESPTKALRRLSRERIGKALDYLRQCDRLEAIHNVRKEIKKVRATFGLVRGQMGENAYHKRVKTLRAAAKRLQDPRDARVRPQALERLTVHFQNRLPARAFVGIKKVLNQNCRAEVREFRKDQSLVVVGRLLRKMNRRAGDLKVKADGWTAIRRGLQESYSQGRKAYEKAREETSPKNLHQWRKQVQNLWHQLRLLRSIQPENLRAAVGEMKILSQYLGDDHDLVMLRRFVGRQCGRRHAREVKQLNQLIELRQKELRSAAFALGSRFYVEKPPSFCRRLENYWHLWHAGKDARVERASKLRTICR
ncbi:MAG TPA: CHAD domain-containing protein [Candidatus Sulfopaludibacter sp.]|nr:CHAD domain-containing protein [Candidatus Sulfopaludibacter sp.]